MALVPRVLLAVLAALLLAAAPAAAQEPWVDPTGGAPWWAGTWTEEDEAVEDEAVVDEDDDAPDVPEGSDAGLPAIPWTPPAPSPAAPSGGQARIVTGRLVRGTRARMRADGRAAVPRGAPRRVRRLIAALNEIVGKPYVWGGGHARLHDRGYDCSGAVSYGLIRTGSLASPLVSGGLARWGRPGAGRWVSIYANAGHVYLEVAGLRLDTSPVRDPSGRKGPRWRPAIGRRPGFAARHLPGL